MKALEVAGCSRERKDWLAKPSDEWVELLESAPSKHDRWKLTQLAQFATASDVAPTAVSDELIKNFLQALRNWSFDRKPFEKVKNAINAWNCLRIKIDGWPQIRLSPLPPRKEPWTFPLETFPSSFQEDVEAWTRRLRAPDIFDATGPSKPLRPSTVKHRRFQIREAASALVRSGFSMDRVTDLDVLVDLENMKAALRWLMTRFDGKPTEAIKGVAVALQAIARHHVQVEDERLAEIKGIVTRLGRDADGLRDKNRRRLLQLEDPANLAILVHLPATLAQKSRRLEASKPRKAALLMQAALAIEILFNAPMRVGNLAALHLERHLRSVGKGRARVTHVHVPAEEVKNAKALDYTLPMECTALLELYLKRARPELEGDPSAYLFPAQNGEAKSPTHLSRLIKETIREHTGLDINAHLFRSIAGKIHSLVQPGDFVTLSHVLNNALGTAMKAYAQFEQRSSLQHYQASLVETRRGGLR